MITNANRLHLGGLHESTIIIEPVYVPLGGNRIDTGCFIVWAFGLYAASGEESEFQIVTSFYPMYIIALNVTQGIEGVEVSNMAGQQTGCLHDYQLQNKDMKNLETADAFIINGAGMESFLDKVLQQLPSLPVINASEGFLCWCQEKRRFTTTKGMTMKKRTIMPMCG